MRKVAPYWWLILALAVIKFILPFILQSPIYELQRDEYLYYQQGLHFDIGYLENPPLLSWLGMISSWLGGSIFWIKFWPGIFGAATLIITCLITAELGGKKFAQFLAGLTMITGAFVRIHFLFQPNIMDVFFWTLAVYFLVRFFNDKHAKFLYAFTISLALGFWGKYSLVFFAASLLLALLITRHRTIFFQKKFYTAALVGLVLITPNVWWQYFHNWPLVHHMKELQETQLKFSNPVDFIKDQLMLLIAALLIWVGGLVWVFKQSQWRFIGFTYLLVLSLLILGRGKSYYSLGAYPMLMAAGAVAWETWSKRMVWIRYALCLLLIGFTYLIIPLLLPTRNPEQLAAFYKKHGFKHKWEDQQLHPLPQDFADMLGWKELTEKTEKLYHSLPDSIASNTIVYCSNYGQAGALKFYGKDKRFTGATFSHNGSFILWMPENLPFKHLILVDEEISENDKMIFQHFRSVTLADSVTNTYSRQLGNKIIFCKDVDSSGQQMAWRKWQDLKKEFSR